MIARRLFGMVIVALGMLALPLGGAARADSVDALARDVGRLESLRQVKDVQRLYAQYSQFGLWSDVAGLFAEKGRIEWGDRTITGRAAITEWLRRRGPRGLASGGLNTDFIEDPLVNLSVDGDHAEGRWSGLAFRGDGKGKATIDGGVYENLYVREGGRWKIAALRYFPQYEGDYADGWANVGDGDLPIIPYHFTPDTAGVPIPPPEGEAPASGPSLTALAARVAVLNDQDGVRNIQNAYGYYVDRKMWDDAADLFAADAVVEIAGVGTFKGRAGVRRMLARMGPAGLSHGELNDRPLFDTVVRISSGGNEALARGTELAMLGEADQGEASWGISVFRNRFVREGGLWKIREMRIQPLMTADYKVGWGKGALPDGARPALPAFLGDNPATGRPVDTSGFTLAAVTPLTSAIAAQGARPAPTLADIRRRYRRALAYDGTENVSAAYSYYLDDFQWPEMAAIFAVDGNKQSPYAGYYMGRARIAGAATARYGTARAGRTGVALHWRIQPVIHVSHDGRSALLRTRLLQPRTSTWSKESGKPNRVGFNTGMYPNDQVVLEDGIWRLWSVTIDEHYFMTQTWKAGWSGVKPTPPGAPGRTSPLLKVYPPDLPMTELGAREAGFAGGTGTQIDWPAILPMWFHYRNPVSGRAPAHYWPDCVPCEKRPQSSMTRHGYQMPPTGPEIDGVNVAVEAGR